MNIPGNRERSLEEHSLTRLISRGRLALPDATELRSRSQSADHSDAPNHDEQSSLQQPRKVSEIDQEIEPASTYEFKRYTKRATLNTLGPLIVLAIYIYVVAEYILRPASNGIIPARLIPAKGIFYAWVILSIFLLDWAKSGLAGFEAAALMKPRFAPDNGMRLLWHADRGWGGLSGWYKALRVSFTYLRHRREGESHALWHGPGLLWAYLSLSSILFYIAIPLSGISMDIVSAARLGKHAIPILGANVTTFALATNNAIQNAAESSWRVGNPTAPEAPTIFYAPQNTSNASSSYYDDAIRNIYFADLGEANVDRTVTFFSGPRVGERAHGRAWGLQISVSCSAYHPSRLRIINNVSSVDDWSAISTASGVISKVSSAHYNLTLTGLEPVFWFADDSLGIAYQYVVASDLDIDSLGNTDYGNSSNLPIDGAFEMLLWQAVKPGYAEDEELKRMMSDTLTMVSRSSAVAADNLTYAGFGVRCDASSNVGLADLDARLATFSNFQQAPTNLGNIDLTTTDSLLALPEFPGPFAIQSIVFGSLSKVTMGYYGPSTCLASTDHICSAFFGANAATGGLPRLVNESLSHFGGQILQLPVISPERMTLALYKLFGQTAATMMQFGPSNWTADLKGLEATSDIVPGRVPWQLVLALLIAWTVVTVVPQILVFTEKRWSSTLEAFELFRFGAEYRETVQHFESNEFDENDVLQNIPGLIGDLEPEGEAGFVGLSKYPADPNRTYVNVRSRKRGKIGDDDM